MADGDERFDSLLRQVLAGPGRFGHREHLHLSWLAIRRFGRAEAVELIGTGIQRTARYAGTPQKYNHTMSRAWVELIAYHLDDIELAEFDEFVSHHSALLDKRLLTRFYEPATLASPQARTGWVAPDRAPLPG